MNIQICIFVAMSTKRIPSFKLSGYLTILFLVLSLFVTVNGTARSNALPFRPRVEWVTRQTIEKRVATSTVRQNKCIPIGRNERCLSAFNGFCSLILFAQISAQFHSAGLS
jgi:hypothetical protein